MLKHLMIGLLLAVLLPLQTLQAQEDVLLTIEKDGKVIDEVSLFEFENIYRKNNQQASVDRQALEDYLQLFVNFKLKVKEAEEAGLDTVPSFVKELQGYRRQLAKPYLIDSKVNENLVTEAYERMGEDIRASHILIRLDESVVSSDTMAAYNKAMAARKRIVGGEDFAKVARATSEDKSVTDNDGDLGYFSVFQMVYPFESAAYALQPGEVSMPVRTRFGYHIVKVTGRRDSKGKIKVAHIMVSVPEKASADDKAKAKAKSQEIYDKLEAGEQFQDLARTFSDDKGSATKGGVLPMFGTGRMVTEFEEAAFALENIGDYSKPVRTPYGWHIIKLLEQRPVAEFDDIKTELKNRVARDGRANRSRSALVKKLRKEYNVKPDNKARNAFYKVVDDSFFEGKWDIAKADGMDKPMFTIDDPNYGKTKKVFTQADFAGYLMSIQKGYRNTEKKPARDVVDLQFDRFVENELINYEEAILEKKYPEFRALMQEYRDGILLFELMDQKVWSKAVKDTVGLQAFYDNNKNNYMWDERVKATVFICANADLAKEARKMAKKNAKKGIPESEIAKALNQDSQLNSKVESGIYLKHDHELVDKTNWVVGFSEDMEVDSKVAFVHVKERVPAQPKTLKESKGLVTADYQTYLEQEWIKELQAKYTVTKHIKVLDKIK